MESLGGRGSGVGRGGRGNAGLRRFAGQGCHLNIQEGPAVAAASIADDHEKLHPNDRSHEVEYSTYYVNLAKRPDRRKSLEDQLALHGMSAERFEAVTGESVDDTVIGRGWKPGLNAFFDTRQKADSWHEMSEGERGCAGSHVALWKKCVADNCPMLVLEDDAIFDSAFSRELLEEAIKHLAKHDPSLLKLEYSRQTTFGDYAKNITASFQICDVVYSWETGGYVVWPQTAAALLNNLPMRAPVDVFLARLAFYKKIPMYACYPPLIHQLYGDNNDIEHTGSQGWSSIEEILENQDFIAQTYEEEWQRRIGES